MQVQGLLEQVASRTLLAAMKVWANLVVLRCAREIGKNPLSIMNKYHVHNVVCKLNAYQGCTQLKQVKSSGP